MPRITHDSDKPNQNHLALLCMMDDSAQDSGIAMYGVAKDLPIIVRYYLTSKKLCATTGLDPFDEGGGQAA